MQNLGNQTNALGLTTGNEIQPPTQQTILGLLFMSVQLADNV